MAGEKRRQVRRTSKKTLRDWLKAAGETLGGLQVKLAGLDPPIQLTVPQLSKLVNGKQWPSRGFVRGVFTITGGEVDANSWAGIET